jgi:glycosyltransferase involved in cell wall biosynthesis/ribosomal protein S18 acetylase RimI-like enzyme
MENLSFGLTAGWIALTTRRPALIYSNSWPIIATGILSAVARLRGIRMVISIQDIYPESLISQGRLGSDHLVSRCMRWIDGIIARRSQKVIVISESFAEVYRRERGVDPSRLQVISNWADSGLVTPNDARASMFRAAKNIPQNAFVILYGGNVGTAAGVDTIIRAFHRLRDIEHLYLVIAGQGSSVTACRELVRELGCPRIIFHSPWAKDETSMVLASADVLILPTSGSQSLASLPSKLISYMLSARPIIANAHPRSDLGTIIEESTCGWVVKPDSPDLLATKIREVMTMDTLELIRRGEMGRAYALRNLTREVCLPKVIDVLEMAGRKEGIESDGKVKIEHHPQMDVRPVSSDEISQVVEIHLRSFPGFFLTFLGRDFLELLYKSIYEDSKGIILVAASDICVRGFVAGVTNQKCFYQSLIARRKWRFAFSALKALIKRPAILFRLVRALHRPTEANKATGEACLMSIAVHTDYVSKGIGQQLVKAFCEELSQRGSPSVCLTTDQVKNEPVNRFYQRLGFQLSNTFITPEGRAMNEYLMVLPKKARGA